MRTRSASRTGSATGPTTSSSRTAGNYFLRLTSGIADVLDAIIQWFQLLISMPAFPSPYPEIGFLGVLAVAWFFTALVAGWRMSIFTAVCFALFSLLGFYEDSMDLLIVTLVSVGLSVLVGLPLAVLMAHSWRARAVFTPVLDVMQTLPSFAYLAAADAACSGSALLLLSSAR